MAVVIRMARRGSKKHPFYRVVAMDHRKQCNGACLEVLGTYDPNKTESKASLVQDRVAYWLSKGAVPSEAVGNILKQQAKLSPAAA